MKVSFLLLILYMMNLLPLTVDAQQNQPILAEKSIAIVQTAYGKVRGYVHNGIYTFKGIPYGKAKRFMPPEKPSAWEGIRNSMTYGPTCPATQENPFKDEFEFPLNRSRGFYTNEECLNLNIWSKKVNDVQKKPVMIWLHGGGFVSGLVIKFFSFGGGRLVTKEHLIVVDIKQRVNKVRFFDLSVYGRNYKH